MGRIWSKKTQRMCLVVVRDAVPPDDHGTVSCIPHRPVSLHAVWSLDGCVCDPATLGVDATGLCAHRVPAHRACTVAVTDARGTTERATVKVGACELPTVVQYECFHATTQHARNGRIVAHVANAPTDCAYLWTSGVVTESPELNLVTPGTYAVTLMTRDSACMPSIHACAPGIISVQPLVS